jgi:hypothetical protein
VSAADSRRAPRPCPRPHRGEWASSWRVFSGAQNAMVTCGASSLGGEMHQEGGLSKALGLLVIGAMQSGVYKTNTYTRTHTYTHTHTSTHTDEQANSHSHEYVHTHSMGSFAGPRTALGHWRRRPAAAKALTKKSLLTAVRQTQGPSSSGPRPLARCGHPQRLDSQGLRIRDEVSGFRALLTP